MPYLPVVELPNAGIQNYNSSRSNNNNNKRQTQAIHNIHSLCIVGNWFPILCKTSFLAPHVLAPLPLHSDEAGCVGASRQDRLVM